MSEPVVTFETLRQCGYCVPRIREWCQRYGIDIKRFSAGVPVSEVLKTGCPFAVRAARRAESSAGKEE